MDGVDGSNVCYNGFQGWGHCPIGGEGVLGGADLFVIMRKGDFDCAGKRILGGSLDKRHRTAKPEAFENIGLGADAEAGDSDLSHAIAIERRGSLAGKQYVRGRVKGETNGLLRTSGRNPKGNVCYVEIQIVKEPHKFWR